MPDTTAKLKTEAIAVSAWKTATLGQVGASPTEIPSSRRQTDSSCIPVTWSYRHPNARDPSPLASPIQTTVVDICAVFDEVITSMLGNVGL